MPNFFLFRGESRLKKQIFIFKLKNIIATGTTK
jgi:hypothetical protein